MKVRGGSKKKAKKRTYEEFSRDFSKFFDTPIQIKEPSDSFPEWTVDEGVKADTEKVMMQLLSPDFMEEVAKVFTFGAQKYGENNYKKGLKVSRILGALDRHLKAFKVLEDNDPETGLSHLAHAACCLQMAFYMVSKSRNFDDRQETFN